jgi:hypothetical protein
MSIGAYFTNKNFPPAAYQKAIAALEAAGYGAPAGRLYHVALTADDGDVAVFDVWESPEALEAFGSVLMPILSGLGVELVPPMVSPVHNVIQG